MNQAKFNTVDLQCADLRCVSFCYSVIEPCSRNPVSEKVTMFGATTVRDAASSSDPHCVSPEPFSPKKYLHIYAVFFSPPFPLSWLARPPHCAAPSRHRHSLAGPSRHVCPSLHTRHRCVIVPRRGGLERDGQITKQKGAYTGKHKRTSRHSYHLSRLSIRRSRV